MLIKKTKCPAIIHAFNTEITDIAGKKTKIVVYTQSKVITYCPKKNYSRKRATEIPGNPAMNYRNVPLKYTHAKQKDLRHTKSIEEMWIFSTIDISLYSI